MQTEIRSFVSQRAKFFGNGKFELIANFSATMMTIKKGETGSVKGETKSANFGKGKCKLIANCANFWQG